MGCATQFIVSADKFAAFFHRNRHAIMAAGGVLGLMHGGAAAFTVLFIQSFGASGWPLMQSGLRRGMAAYELAKERAPRETDEYRHEVQHLRKELIGLAEQLAALRREGATEQAQNEVIRQMKRVRREIEAVPPSRRAAPVLVAACDASVVRDVCLGIWSGVTVSLRRRVRLQRARLGSECRWARRCRSWRRWWWQRSSH